MPANFETGRLVFEARCEMYESHDQGLCDRLRTLTRERQNLLRVGSGGEHLEEAAIPGNASRLSEIQAEIVALEAKLGPETDSLYAGECQLDQQGVKYRVLRSALFIYYASLFRFSLLESFDIKYVTEENLFVELSSDTIVSEEQAIEVLYALLFELSSSLGLALAPQDLGLHGSASTDDDGEPQLPEPRLRPLLLGKALLDPLKIYNKALLTEDDQIRILFYTQIIEFISKTVINSDLMSKATRKLRSSRALEPDAGFVMELRDIFAEAQSNRNDREAIRLAVKVCCDPNELAQASPPFLASLKTIGPGSKQSNIEAALDDFAQKLYATRNSIAHAKANYDPTGLECPSAQLPEFSECARLAAEQAIRWFADQPSGRRLG